ncbi:hypothetical protein GCM10023149_32250 [Mucilaginibacter gynuensis]|uniref:Glycosyltransferase subfamily 4-like N-terminal domain-containing protein n=1 Tax=Mucilaginibacter gynuensis TaxID=1302236 RepID=A0ABP8GQR9_9SPHI
MKNKVLIISPYFVPTNAADMHRVRTSLPYFEQLGWDAEVVTVDVRYADIVKDDLLLRSVPGNIKTHIVKALPKKWTAKLGLGSLALRSLWYYYRYVNKLLKQGNYDLIYFSTTQFPVCVLGAYWKKRFNIPYVIDMQDPWHSDYYRDKPKDQRPPKYWFSYRLNKYLEPIAMNHADGLISVSELYINDLQQRYLRLKTKPSATITFGAYLPDVEIAKRLAKQGQQRFDKQYINIVYVGRGGDDMAPALSVLFESLQQSIIADAALFGRLKFHFIGTSYAPAGEGRPTILPIAKQYSVSEYVTEQIDRVSYYEALSLLQQADALFIPGSDDPKYTASKLYPYLLSGKPLLSLFNSKSSAVGILNEFGLRDNYSYDNTPDIGKKITCFFKRVIGGEHFNTQYNEAALHKYSALNTTAQQCKLFNEVIHAKN